jgi:hypothetical protein
MAKSKVMAKGKVMKGKVKKKPLRFSLPVSKTNFHRVKFGTHSLVRVLQLEGYEVQDNHVVSEGTRMRLDAIDLWPRRKRGEEAQPQKEQDA